jgi:hypothetical protein
MSYFARLVQQSQLAIGNDPVPAHDQPDATEQFDLEEHVETLALQPNDSSVRSARDLNEINLTGKTPPSPGRGGRILGNADAFAPQVRLSSPPDPVVTQPSEAVELAAAASAPPTAETPNAEYVLQRVMQWIAATEERGPAPEVTATTEVAAAPVTSSAQTRTASQPLKRDAAIEVAELVAPAARVAHDVRVEQLVTEHVIETERVQRVPSRRIAAMEPAADSVQSRPRPDVAEEVSVSIGAINVTIEAPAPVMAPPQHTVSPPAAQESRQSARLARHYLRP